VTKNSRKGRGGKQPRRQHLRSVPTVDEAPRTHQPEDQQLILGLRKALRSDHPVDFLGAVSSIMAAADPREHNPFSHDEPHVDLEQLLESFVGVDIAETTAALTVIHSFVSDELAAARIGKELTRRRQPMPAWLNRLYEVEITGVMEMTEVLGDGDDYFLEAALATGENFTALVYVDHNLGTVVKDAFVVPGPLDLVLPRMKELMTPDQTIAAVDAAQTRAIVTEAIDHGALFWPPVESDTWPLCRPLVEWLVRRLPEGGPVPARPEWSDDQLEALRAEFFASSYGRELDRPDERSLLESLNWFGTDYGPGDPLRWSPVNVEILMTDWIPRKIVAEAAYLAKVPNLLRAFIRFCHDHRAIRRELTEETLAAVDHWEPEYQRLIRSSRPQGPAALIAGMLDSQDFEYDDGYDPDEPIGVFMLRQLDKTVGGRHMLMNLDDAPLPDEPFEWAGVPEDIHSRVREILELSDRCADELLDVEHRTAMRRFVSRAAVGDPVIFRRKGAPDRAAAAVAWVVTKANDSVGLHRSLEVQGLLAWFGVKGSVAQRAEVFLKAIGVDPHRQYGGMDLGAEDLLVSDRRRQIIELRERYLQMD